MEMLPWTKPKLYNVCIENCHSATINACYTLEKNIFVFYPCFKHNNGSLVRSGIQSLAGVKKEDLK